MSKKWLWFSIIFAGLSACAHQTSEPLYIGESNSLPDIAVEFETTVIEPTQQERHYRWYFWRTVNRVETQNLRDNSGEVWTKSVTGDVEYARVFHNEKQMIDYRSSDLNAIGTEPNWAGITLLLNPAIAKTLMSDGQTEIFGRTGIEYKNNNVENPVDIIWLADEKVPAMIQRVEHGHTLVTRIVTLYSLEKSALLHQSTANYRHIDFADIGDKE
ncbi:MAG: hypothetical protein PHN45_01895 [Methylococcales bacterium]|nr:hypothetical protein [Methylococcales bacterium]MDD5753491.1 hypothetical protein [Methylococcales bacterium]